MDERIAPVTMTAQDAAKYLGISYWLILEMVKQNKIPFIPLGSKRLFRKVALDKWIEEMETKSVETTTDSQISNEYGKLRKIR